MAMTGDEWGVIGACVASLITQAGAWASSRRADRNSKRAANNSQAAATSSAQASASAAAVVTQTAPVSNGFATGVEVNLARILREIQAQQEATAELSRTVLYHVTHHPGGGYQ